MSEAAKDEIRKNLSVRSWRLKNLYTIQAGGTDEHPEVGLVPFNPNHAQRKYYNAQHNLDAILKARKLGLSTFKAVEFADFGTFVPRLTMGIIDYKLNDAKSKLAMISTAYNNLGNGDVHPDTWRLGAKLMKKNPLTTDAKECLEWSNGSRVTVDTAFRGANPQKLHLSEFGKVAAFRPKAATEIVNGAFNSVLPGMCITSESTHEAGTFGEHYRLLKRAMAVAHLPKLSPLDWKFHFNPWFEHPLYRVDPEGRTMRPEIVKYFEDLEKNHGIRCNEAQMFWYDLKEQEQGYGMKKEFPSTPGEAFEALVKGAIWGREIMDLRARGGVKELAVGPEPIYTFWDIGYSDYTAIWLIQPAGRDFLVHGFYQNHRLMTGRYAEVIRQWERQHNQTISQHFLPHDAESHGGAGLSPLEDLLEAGIAQREITIVPRTPDLWAEINHARKLLPRCYFHKATDESYKRDGEEMPSGLACLSNYKTRVNSQDDFETNMIVHDEFSHPADAFRTFAAAERAGLIRHAADKTTLTIANYGPTSHSPTRRRRR